ncbi:potassium transporter TrkA [Micromonospora globbae]|uniref:Potassium transporter TrkA n=1 Tax=Micromonospora globbae TaxID=1894969 RepID=A0ABZ1SBX5_9ACTN|nr:TrkA C-terminal domain-containing protein [Micromonospora globbae]
MQIERVPLPGIGVSYTLHTTQGRLLGVVCHRSGRRELVLYAPDDPDTVQRSLVLTDVEAREVAELLHPVATIEHVPDLERRAASLTVATVPVTAVSPYAGSTVGEAVAGVRGVTVIAVLSDGRSTTAPEPGHRIAHGDALVVAGTPDGVAALSRRLTPDDP